jgi:hypothetical protein
MMDLIIGQPQVIRISSVSDEYSVNEILNRNERAAFMSSSRSPRGGAQLTPCRRRSHHGRRGRVRSFRLYGAHAHVDLNGDRIDDLLIGAPTLDGILGGAKQDAGQIYLIYGNYRTAVMPVTGYGILTNRTITGSGSFLVDTGIGRPTGSTIPIWTATGSWMPPATPS